VDFGASGQRWIELQSVEQTSTTRRTSPAIRQLALWEFADSPL
jgi:hypothetical protein